MEQTANTIDGVFKLKELPEMYQNRLLGLSGQAAEKII